MQISIKELKKLIKTELDEAKWRVSPPKSKKNALPIDVEADSKRGAAQSAIDQWAKKGHDIDLFTVDVEEITDFVDATQSYTGSYDPQGPKSDVYEKIDNVIESIVDGILHDVEYAIADGWADSDDVQDNISEDEFRDKVFERLKYVLE